MGRASRRRHNNLVWTLRSPHSPGLFNGYVAISARFGMGGSKPKYVAVYTCDLLECKDGIYTNNLQEALTWLRFKHDLCVLEVSNAITSILDSLASRLKEVE